MTKKMEKKMDAAKGVRTQAGTVENSKKQRESTMQKAKLIFLRLAVIVAAFVFVDSASKRLLIPETTSVPGALFYVGNKPKKLRRWDYVLIKEPNDPYVRQNAQGKPLLKMIACLPYEDLWIDGSGNYRCNFMCLGKALDRDSKGRKLHHFKWDGPIPEGCYFVVGTDPRSYDSRYFGFVKREQIIAKAYRIF